MKTNRVGGRGRRRPGIPVFCVSVVNRAIARGAGLRGVGREDVRGDAASVRTSTAARHSDAARRRVIGVSLQERAESRVDHKDQRSKRASSATERCRGAAVRDGVDRYGTPHDRRCNMRSDVHGGTHAIGCRLTATRRSKADASDLHGLAKGEIEDRTGRHRRSPMRMGEVATSFRKAGARTALTRAPPVDEHGGGLRAAPTTQPIRPEP